MKLSELYDKFQKEDLLVIKLGDIDTDRKLFRTKINKDTFDYLYTMISKKAPNKSNKKSLQETVFKNGLVQIDEISDDKSITTSQAFFSKNIASFTKEMVRINLARQTYVIDAIKEEKSYIRIRDLITYSINMWDYKFSHVSLKGSLESHYEFEIQLNRDELLLSDLQSALSSLEEKITPIRKKFMIKEFIQEMLKSNEDYLRLWNRPAGLDWKNINKIKDYAVTPKIDGEHRVVAITSDKVFIVDSRWNAVEMKTKSNKIVYQTIAEAELYQDVIYIFDVLFWDGKDIRSAPLEDRINKMKTLASDLGCMAKSYVLTGDNVFSRSKTVLDSNPGYDIDGLIYTSKGSYADPIYKWKPISHCTVDFWVTLDTKRRKTRLYVTITKNAANRMNKRYDKYVLKLKEDSIFVPYQFNSTDLFQKTEDGQRIRNKTVVECRYDIKKSKWIPMRVRDDKTALFHKEIDKGSFAGPNYFTTALSTFRYIQKPITKENITNENADKGYYTGIDRNDSDIKPMLSFHNWVKQHMYETYVRKNDSILELAGGRGGDLWKLVKTGLKEILLVDVDQVALNEADSRWTKSIKDKNIIMKTEQANLLEVHEAFRTSSNKPFDVVSCQMAIHYFFKDELAFEHFYQTAKSSVCSGGFFMFTVFNGKRIQQLMENKTDTIWKNKKGDRMLQISYGKLSENAIPFEQEVLVFLDTIGEHPEYLVDIEWLIERMSDDFTMIDHKSFSDMHGKWKNNLSTELQRFSFLYDYIVLKRK